MFDALARKILDVMSPPPAADPNSLRDRIVWRTVDEALPDGRYRVGDDLLATIGTAKLRAGERAAVLMQGGRAIGILAHQAKRAQGQPRAEGAVGIVEQLILAPESDGATVSDVWFRNDVQLTALDLTPWPEDWSQIWGPFWGLEDNTFFVIGVYSGTHSRTAASGANKYHFRGYRLNRDANTVLGAAPATAELIADFRADDAIVFDATLAGGPTTGKPVWHFDDVINIPPPADSGGFDVIGFPHYYFDAADPDEGGGFLFVGSLRYYLFAGALSFSMESFAMNLETGALRWRAGAYANTGDAGFTDAILARWGLDDDERRIAWSRQESAGLIYADNSVNVSTFAGALLHTDSLGIGLAADDGSGNTIALTASVYETRWPVALSPGGTASDGVVYEFHDVRQGAVTSDQSIVRAVAIDAEGVATVSTWLNRTLPTLMDSPTGSAILADYVLIRAPGDTAYFALLSSGGDAMFPEPDPETFPTLLDVAVSADVLALELAALADVDMATQEGSDLVVFTHSAAAEDAEVTALAEPPEESATFNPPAESAVNYPTAIQVVNLNP